MMKSNEDGQLEFDFKDASLLMPKKRIRIGHTLQEYTIHKLADGRIIRTDHDYPYDSMDNPMYMKEDRYEEITDKVANHIMDTPEFPGNQEFLDQQRKHNPNYSGGVILNEDGTIRKGK
jgi:hypothetical protein